MSNINEHGNRTHWNKQGLKDRGWTMTMIDRFLPIPDTTRPNPRYKCAPPMKLYDVERVLIIEESEQFKVAKQKSLARKQSARKAVKTKEKKLLEYIDSIEIIVPIMSIDKLSRKAIESYNEWQYEKMNFDNGADENSDPDFLDRIMVNYLRHELTEYDNELNLIRGKAGKQNAYIKLKEKILNAISEAYPDLEIECQRQILSLYCSESWQ